jgi:hypothetical protein
MIQEPHLFGVYDARNDPRRDALRSGERGVEGRVGLAFPLFAAQDRESAKGVLHLTLDVFRGPTGELCDLFQSRIIGRNDLFGLIDNLFVIGLIDVVEAALRSETVPGFAGPLKREDLPRHRDVNAFGPASE